MVQAELTLPAKTEQPQNLTLAQHIARLEPDFSRVLPGHITAERFVRTAQTAITMTRNIDKVKNPKSLLNACAKAAADGLVLDGREAALVIDRDGNVQYRPMVRGLLKLARNSGEIRGIIVEPVHVNDVFIHKPTKLDEPVVHEIDHRKDRGEIYLVYAIAELTSGVIQAEVMTVAKINAIRDRSDGYRAFKAGKIKSTPWSTDWEEMARKTVLRRLCKYLPSSSETSALMDAVERDDDFKFEIDGDVVANDQQPEHAAPKKRGGGAAALKNITPEKDEKPKEEVKAEPAAKQEPERKPAQDAELHYDPKTGEIYDDELEPMDDF